MVSKGNQHCANCIGTLSLHMDQNTVMNVFVCFFDQSGVFGRNANLFIYFFYLNISDNGRKPLTCR